MFRIASSVVIYMYIASLEQHQQKIHGLFTYALESKAEIYLLRLLLSRRLPYFDEVQVRQYVDSENILRNVYSRTVLGFVS